jgi:hypothetical protein
MIGNLCLLTFQCIPEVINVPLFGEVRESQFGNIGKKGVLSSFAQAGPEEQPLRRWVIKTEFCWQVSSSPDSK